MKKVVAVVAVVVAVAAAFILVVARWSTPAPAQTPSAQQLYTKLYCPLCGGVRLDACELQVCNDMRQEISQKLAAGESEQEIVQYYRARWGDQVLGYPPAEGINLVPWLIPLVLVLGGGIVLWRMASGWTRSRHAAAALPVSESLVPAETVARVERELYE